jgi:Kef-type K+ transport system membrane component KefB
MSVDEASFLEALGIMMLMAAVVVLLTRRLRVPSIVAYIIAGLAVGPVFGLLAPEALNAEALATVSEMGIVLLLFLVGLELSLDRIRQVGKVALVAGIGQVVFTAAGGLGLCKLLGFSWMEAVFIATALTFSSTVVVVKLLDQKGELHSLYGRIAVGIFLVQDLVVIVVLTFLAGLGTPEALEPTAIAWGLAKAFGGMGLLLAACLLAARYLLPRPLAWAARSPRLLFVCSIAWCFLFVISAHAMGLSAEIGAFLAGLSIAQLPCAHDLQRRVHPLMSIFIVVFFVSLGAQMRLGDAGAFAFEASILSIFVLVGNPFIFMLIIARYGYSQRTSFYTSVTVAQISEFSFIFAAMGVNNDLIGAPILALIALVGFVTIAGSAYMILYNGPLYAFVARLGLLRIFRARQGEDEGSEDRNRVGHVIVVGMNPLGRAIATALHDRGEEVLAIDTDAHKLEGLACATKLGSVEYPALLTAAGAAGAKLVISALRIESTNRILAYRLSSAGVPVAVHAFDRSVVDVLRDAGADYLLRSKRDGGLVLTRLASSTLAGAAALRAVDAGGSADGGGSP